MQENLSIPLPRWPKSARDFDAEEAEPILRGEKTTQRTPEEDFKISRFYRWLEETAQEQRLSADQKALRNALYEAVNVLRPSLPVERHRAAEAQVETWASEHPGDPLAAILHDYIQSSLEEALLWREAFPELEREETPTLSTGRK